MSKMRLGASTSTSNFITQEYSLVLMDILMPNKETKLKTINQDSITLCFDNERKLHKTNKEKGTRVNLILNYHLHFI